MIFADQITYGFALGTITAVVLFAAALFLAFVWWPRVAASANNSNDERLAKWIQRFAYLLPVIVVVGYVWASWPFKHDYHWWVDKTGTVSAVSSRLIPSGDKSVQQRFVFVVNGEPLGVDDTRASLVKPGARVSLRCHKENEWGTPQEAHGWKCKWNGPAEVG